MNCSCYRLVTCTTSMIKLNRIFHILTCLITLGCGNQTEKISNRQEPAESIGEAKQQTDSLAFLERLTPTEFSRKELIYFNDGKKVFLRYVTADTVECDYPKENGVCNKEMVRIISIKDTTWYLSFSTSLFNPLLNNYKVNDSKFNLDSTHNLEFINSYKPTCCSRIISKHYYDVSQNNPILTAMTYNINNRNNNELIDWTYTIDLVEKNGAIRIEKLYPKLDSAITLQKEYDVISTSKKFLLGEKVTLEDVLSEDQIVHQF